MRALPGLFVVIVAVAAKAQDSAPKSPPPPPAEKAVKVVSQEAAKPNYFPHSKGSTWEYRRTFGKDVKDLTVRIGETTKSGESTLVKITDDFEYVGFKPEMEFADEGVFYPAYPSVKGQPDRPQPILVKSTLKVGDEWNSLLPAGCGFSTAKATVNGPEEIEVPAGKFNAVKVTYSGKIFGSKTSMLVWYADGAGVVKQVFSPTGSNIIIELTKYTPR